MNDLEKKSIECLKNMPIEETTYQVARNVVLDYITNLQQENERLKINNKILKQNNINEVLRNDFDMCVKDLKKANKKIEKLEDYKSRIDKAVEYIEQQPRRELSVDSYFKFEDLVEFDELLNILNGKE